MTSAWVDETSVTRNDTNSISGSSQADDQLSLIYVSSKFKPFYEKHFLTFAESLIKLLYKAIDTEKN